MGLFPLEILKFDPLSKADVGLRAVIERCEGGVCMKRGTGRSVWRLQGDDGPVVVKLRRVRGLVDRVRTRIEMSALRREMQGLWMLEAIGVRIGTPRAWMICRRGDEMYEAVAFEWLAGPTLLEAIAQRSLTPAQERQVCEGLSGLIHTLDRVGVINRDLKPSNIIVVDARNVAVIDAAGVRASWNRPRSVVRMLTALIVEPVGAGCPPRRTLRMRLLRALAEEFGAGSENARREARRLWRQVQREVESHGDPTPVDDPLGRPRVAAAPQFGPAT